MPSNALPFTHTLTQLPDGAIRLCLHEHGFSSCGTVSSHHLIEPKLSQLKADIAAQAFAVYKPL